MRTTVEEAQMKRALTTTAAMERAVVKGQVIRRAAMKMLKSKR